ncbi:MAG: CPBP family intramembrane glutamic endopeptidase [Solirubrobacteraceae bacterium]
MTAATCTDATSTFRPTVYIWAIIGCAIVSVLGSPLAGSICDALVVLWLLNSYALTRDESSPAVLLALSLVPLLGLVGLAIPVTGVSRVLHDALVAALLLQALWLASRMMPTSRRVLQVNRQDLPQQLLIAACGIPLGIAGQQILHPHPLAHPGHPAPMVLAAIVLGCLVAPSLELTFRWVLQEQLLRIYPDSALVLVNVLFVGAYLGTRSLPFVILIGLTGLGLSVAVRRTRNVWGAVGAHALLSIGVLVIWPAVLG